MITTRSLRFSAVVPIVLALSACGSAGDTAAPDGDTPSDSIMSGEMEGMDHGDNHGPFAFGEPADEADADRTVEVEAMDTLAYDPATVAIEAGETITFVVTNSGTATHEFVIGDAAVQEEHALQMQEMSGSGMHMDDEPNAISLDAGETKSITWHFTEAGEVQFACHQPGHYAGGMVGTVDVS